MNSMDKMAKENVLQKIMSMASESIEKKLKDKKKPVSISLTVSSPDKNRLHELREKLMEKKED